jgi:hypothetical protein
VANPDALPMSITRRATVAARLKAIYGSINNVDAFVGVFAEKHIFGSEFGSTQLAVWQKQFQALRDGDRFYFGNDQGLSFIKNAYGIDFHHTLAQIIELNTDVTADRLNPTGNVFFLPDAALPATACSVRYDIVNLSATTFKGVLHIKNTSNQTIVGWQTQFALAQGQTLISDLGINITQSGSNGLVWTGRDVGGFGAVIAPGETETVEFTASYDGLVNQRPGNISLNNRRCAVP